MDEVLDNLQESIILVKKDLTIQYVNDTFIDDFYQYLSAFTSS